MVELDVQLSKDKVPVIYHDYNINIFTQKVCITFEKKFCFNYFLLI